MFQKTNKYILRRNKYILENILLNIFKNIIKYIFKLNINKYIIKYIIIIKYIFIFWNIL